MAGVLSTSHKSDCKLGDTVDSDRGCNGLYFGLRCIQGRAVLLTALGLPGYDYYGGTDSEVLVYVCVEGDGAGREQQREAWRQVASGALKDRTVTQLTLSTPVAVEEGATVGFYLRATKGYVQRCPKQAALGTVDASDGVLSVLMGGRQDRDAGLFGECFDYPHECAAPVGFFEYQVGDTVEKVIRQQGIDDKALPAGTRLRVEGLGVGTYERWSQNWIGANDHFVRFGASQVEQLQLKILGPQAWAVVALVADVAGAEPEREPEPETAAATSGDLFTSTTGADEKARKAALGATQAAKVREAKLRRQAEKEAEKQARAEAEEAAALAHVVGQERARADAAIAEAVEREKALMQAINQEKARADAAIVEKEEAAAQAQVLAARASQAQAEAKAVLAEAALTTHAEQVVAKVAAAASSGPTIDEWLAELDLSEYAAPMKQHGYTSLRFLVEGAEEADLDELAQDIGMKKPHLRVLKRTWKKLVADAGSAGAEGTSASVAASAPASEPQPVSADDTSETHGQAVQEMQPDDEFDFVFSNKTASDALCLDIRAKLTARGLHVWQQKTNIPKDSDNWFNEWFPSAVKSRKIVCFLTVAYLKSPYCMKEFGIALASHKLLVVACEPLAQINAVDPSAYPFASNALAYLMNGGQVIFHDTEDVVAEILKFVQ